MYQACHFCDVNGQVIFWRLSEQCLKFNGCRFNHFSDWVAEFGYLRVTRLPASLQPQHSRSTVPNELVTILALWALHVRTSPVNALPSHDTTSPSPQNYSLSYTRGSPSLAQRGDYPHQLDFRLYKAKQNTHCTYSLHNIFAIYTIYNALRLNTYRWHDTICNIIH